MAQSTPTKRRRTLGARAGVKLGELVPEAITAISEAVKAGDVAASLAVISYVLPKPKPVNGAAFNLKQDISKLTLTEQLAAINQGVLNGEVSMEAADTVLGILLKSRQLLESNELEERIKAIEDAALDKMVN